MKLFLVFLMLGVVPFVLADNDLLILHAEGGATLNGVAANIEADPFYGDVHYWDAYTAGLATLSTLQNYDCVFTWNNYQYAAGQGDALADYVDAGGKVVLLGWGIAQCYGRIIDDASYCPLIGGSNLYGSVNLGTTYPPHDILNGVTSITNIDYQVQTSMESGATRIADDTAGLPLCAINAAETVAAINMVAGDYIIWTGDGWILFNNTIHYLMTGPGALQQSTWGAIKAGF
jgi:hypothetical protein